MINEDSSTTFAAHNRSLSTKIKQEKPSGTQIIYVPEYCCKIIPFMEFDGYRSILMDITPTRLCIEVVDVSRVSPCVINLSRNKNICFRLKKVDAKSRARVYFEQQILALLLVFHQTHNLSSNKFARALANQPISAPHFFNLQQMFLLRVKLITQGEKREKSIKTCNETMLRDKLKVFVSRISPPLCKWWENLAKLQTASSRRGKISIPFTAAISISSGLVIH